MAVMTRPTPIEIARLVREMIAKGATDRALIVEVTGLSERQLRRRLDGEVPFKAHEYVAIINNQLPRKVA